MMVESPEKKSVHPSAVFNIPSVVIPELAAAEDEAPLVECAVNVVTSIPEILWTSFNHRAMVMGSPGYEV